MDALAPRTNGVILAALAGTMVASATAQDPDPRAIWLAEHAVAPRSIDPADEDFADLAPLAEWIGDARVVGLGEQTHGDGATFHAKVRLVKFLHQELGFDVLVWESGMFDCARIETALRGGESIHDVWRRGIFGVWGVSEQVQPLFDYVQRTRDTERPLEIAGMDSQLTGDDSRSALRDYLLDLVAAAPEDHPVRVAVTALAPRIDDLSWTELPELGRETVDEAHARVAILLQALADQDEVFARLSDRDRSFASRTVRNLDAMLDMIYWGAIARRDGQQREAMLAYGTAREPAMADTLVWLARERYPDKKLVVWAASSHLTFNSRRVEWPEGDDQWKFDDTEWEPMGNAVRAALGEELYVIDFLAHSGQLGSVAGWSRELPAPDAGTIDALCEASGKPYLFVDLRAMPELEGGAWLRERLVARPRGYAPMRASWGEVCDAFFFTSRMYPSTRAQ